jgi:hypothetical protein
MPNLAFQIEVLKQVITARAADGDPIAKILSGSNFNNPEMQFAVLGALGPDILRYTPISNQLATFLSNLVPSATSGTALTSAQIATQTSAVLAALSALPTGTQAQQALGFELYFNPVSAIYSVLFSTLVIPVWPILNHTSDVFNQLITVIQNQNSAGLIGMMSALEGLQGVQTSLVGLPSTVALLQVVIGVILTQGPWMEQNQPLPPPADPVVDRRYEFLNWHHTGSFAQKLLANATTANQKAYAFGWLCHIASSVTGEPFVNNIVGGPYRTHWWRNRLAGNFVDSWTFGFFEQSPLPTMGGPTGDNPKPAYYDTNTGKGWPSICSANLQNQFNVANLAGPSTPDGVPAAVTAMASGNISTLLSSSPFPTEISTLLTTTINATYTVPLGSTLFPGFTTPIVGLDASGNPIPAFASDTFARAYIGAFAVYWFMTSGSGPIGNNTLLTPSSYYDWGAVDMPEPAWVKSGGSPSTSQAGVSIGAAICDLLLAIFGIWVYTDGNLHAGIFNLTSLPGVVDWNMVANNAYWLQKTLVDQENRLRDAMVWTALTYPPPVYLGAIDSSGNTLPVTDLTPPQPSLLTGSQSPNVPATQGVFLTKTNPLSVQVSPGSVRYQVIYPRSLDTTSSGFADLDFDSYPLVPAEQNITNSLIPPGLYPQSLIMAALNPVANGGMLTSGAWPTRSQLFGGPVANALQLFDAQDKGLLSGLQDYNLDADRGYGWLTWDPKTGSNPSTPPVVVVKEP